MMFSLEYIECHQNYFPTNTQGCYIVHREVVAVSRPLPFLSLGLSSSGSTVYCPFFDNLVHITVIVIAAACRHYLLYIE